MNEAKTMIVAPDNAAEYLAYCLCVLVKHHLQSHSQQYTVGLNNMHDNHNL